MGLADEIQADAKTLMQQDGVAVTYTGASGAVSTYAIRATPELSEQATNDRRTNRKSLLVAIPRADVSEVRTNQDTLTIPGAWVEGADDRTGTVVRIAESTSPGAWVLEVSYS